MELQERIIAYCANELDEDQKREFDLLLTHNEVLRSEVENYMFILQGIDFAGDEVLRHHLHLIEEKLSIEGHFIDDDEIIDYLHKNENSPNCIFSQH